MRKRKVTIILLFLALFFSIALCIKVPKSHAAFYDVILKFFGSSNVQENQKEFEQDLTNETSPSIGQLGSNVTKTIMYFALASTTGAASTNLSPTEQAKLEKYFGRGAIADVGTGIAYLYTPPASTETYIADLMQSAHIIPKAYAQGLGYSSLNPILSVWKIFRNLAYFLFVIVFLVIGFMIMLRHKISGQTVVTAQQAIPQVIIALVFVTFSYAIAGLLIDLMFLIMYLLVGLFGKSTDLVSFNIIQLGINLVTQGTGETFSSVNTAVQNIVESAGLGSIAKNVAGGVSGITVALIIGVAILIGIFKLFFELLKTYIAIILYVTFSPIILMMGALPGQNTFFSWIKNLAMNLLVFPVVLLMLIIHKTIVESGITSGGFMPPYMLSASAGQSSAIVALIGVGIILIIPEVVKKVKPPGGIWEEFLTAMGRNAMAGEIALPLGAGTVGQTYGSIAGGKAYRDYKNMARNPMTMPGLWKAMREGYKTEEGRIIGGGQRYGERAYDWGTNARINLDRLLEGRYFEAEDIQKSLSRLYKPEKAQKPNK